MHYKPYKNFHVSKTQGAITWHLLELSRIDKFLIMLEKNDLEWKTFSDHLSSTTKRLMETKELADVTLVTDDQKQVLAHKIFLSAGSEIFRNILINNPHKHPFIYLTNIKHQELEAIIQFLYLGTASLYQDRIDDFLSAAKSLQVKEMVGYSSYFSI